MLACTNVRFSEDLALISATVWSKLILSASVKPFPWSLWRASVDLVRCSRGPGVLSTAARKSVWEADLATSARGLKNVAANCEEPLEGLGDSGDSDCRPSGLRASTEWNRLRRSFGKR